MLRLIPKLSQNNFKYITKMMRENIETYHPNTTFVQILAPMLEPLALNIPGVARCFWATCFSEHMGGTCWTDVGVSWGTPGQMIFTFGMVLGHVLPQMSNIPKWKSIPREQITPITFNNNKSRIQKIRLINPKIVSPFRCLTKPRRSEAPACLIGSAELPKG